MEIKITPDQTLFEITETYPETIEVFASNGFSKMSDPEQRKILGKNITLKTAMTIKSWDLDDYMTLLKHQITETREGSDITLTGQSGTTGDATNEKTEKLSVMGLLPCPVRIPLLEAFSDFSKTRPDLSINYELKAASMGLGWLEEKINNHPDPEALPDVFLSAGFDLFFDPKLMGRYRDEGVFADFSSLKVYNSDFKEQNLMDPQGMFSLIALVPAVFLVNTKALGDIPIPKTWEDLLDPIFENRVSLPVGDFDLFNAILLTLTQKYGREGVRKLGRSFQKSLHPSEMVKSHRKAEPPWITIMPYFFTRTIREGGTMQAVWPEDGAIISPIFMLTKKEKQEALQPIVDFFTSRKTGEILSHKGLFPSVHPEVVNELPENAPFQWPGWDFIMNNDIASKIEEAMKDFDKGSEGRMG